jgi:hypothetical protein
VAAEATLREAVLSAGDGAAARWAGRRLVTAGLLAWGRRSPSPSQGPTSAGDLERHAALPQRPPWAAAPAVAVGRVRAPMARHALHHLAASA